MLLILIDVATEGLDIVWTYDCKSMYSFVEGRAPRQLLGYYRDFQRAKQALTDRGCRLHAFWVPSHDKPLPAGWSCGDFTCEQECRDGNASADAAATAARLALHHDDDARLRLAHGQACLWSTAALHMAASIMTKWRSFCEHGADGAFEGLMIAAQ